jgi:hypothetical protein
MADWIQLSTPPAGGVDSSDAASNMSAWTSTSSLVEAPALTKDEQSSLHSGLASGSKLMDGEEDGVRVGSAPHLLGKLSLPSLAQSLRSKTLSILS